MVTERLEFGKVVWCPRCKGKGTRPGVMPGTGITCRRCGGSGIVPNEDGRVVDPATGAPVPCTYVGGWAKRGPTGHIGTNKGCSQDTVGALVDDHNAGLLRPLTPRR